LAAQSKGGPETLSCEQNEKELMRLRQIKALKAAIGAWRDEEHPELERDAAAWVAKVRREDEKRYRKVSARR
jgi:hypothetical protein